jgi:hypothetical protein
MRSTPQRRLAIPLGLCALVMMACGGTVSTSPSDTAGKDNAVSNGAIEGTAFKKFFPIGEAHGGWGLVFGATKQGYAEASLKKDGNEVAVLSITDTVGDPSAKDKFKNSMEKINGYPVGAEENLIDTDILVANRFQVRVRTTSIPNFFKDDRVEWIKKFNLEGLAKLAK